MNKTKLLESIEQYLADAKYDKALKVFQKLIATYPEDMRLKLKLGDLYVKRKELAVAVGTYQEVAEAYVKEQFHLKAIAVYKKNSQAQSYDDCDQCQVRRSL